MDVLGNHARGTGALQIMNLKGGELELVKEKEKKDAIKCGTFGHSSLAERMLATGDFKGVHYGFREYFSETRERRDTFRYSYKLCCRNA